MTKQTHKKTPVDSLSTLEEIQAFYSARIPQLSESMPMHTVLGYIAVYVNALELQLETAEKRNKTYQEKLGMMNMSPNRL